MILIRNEEKHNICLTDDNNVKILEAGYVGADFVILLYTQDSIVIDEEVDKSFYMNFIQIMNNKYLFGNNGLSYQRDNEIRWFSDQYCDIDNPVETDKIDRVIAKITADKILIHCDNPFCKKNSIEKKQYVISFSPNGNGFYSRNVDSGLSFQDDVVIAFNNILNNEYSNSVNTNFNVKKLNIF